MTNIFILKHKKNTVISTSFKSKNTVNLINTAKFKVYFKFKLKLFHLENHENATVKS